MPSHFKNAFYRVFHKLFMSTSTICQKEHKANAQSNPQLQIFLRAMIEKNNFFFPKIPQ